MKGGLWRNLPDGMLNPLCRDHRRDLRIDRESIKITNPVKEIKHLLSDCSDQLASSQDTRKPVQKNRPWQSSKLTRPHENRAPDIKIAYSAYKSVAWSDPAEQYRENIWDADVVNIRPYVPPLWSNMNPTSRILYDYSQIMIMYAFAFIKLWIFAMACKMHCWFTQTLYKAHRKRS